MLDSYFVPSVLKQESQDYASHNENIACLSDGCGSTDSALGARLITMVGLCHHDIIPHLNMMQSLYQLKEENLYASLLRIDVAREKINFYGDGVYASLYEEECDFSYNDFEFPLNMPFYPIYSVKSKLFEHYRRQIDNQVHLTTFFKWMKSMRTHTLDEQLIDWPLRKECITILFSDGIKSFYNRDLDQILKTEEFLYRLHPIKNKSGRWLERRCRKVIKELAKEGYHNQDDFSAIGYLNESQG